MVYQCGSFEPTLDPSYISLDNTFNVFFASRISSLAFTLSGKNVKASRLWHNQSLWSNLCACCSSALVPDTELSDTEVIRYQTGQVQNCSDTELIRYRTDQIPNWSDTELLRYRTDQISNRSDTKLIGYRTVQIPNLSDTELILLEDTNLP